MQSFHHKEKLKRISLTKQLLERGFTIKKLSEYFGVSEDTVKEYIREARDLSTDTNSSIILTQKQDKTLNTLESFSNKSVSTKEFFNDSKIKTNRLKCALCNQFFHKDATIKWNNQITICKTCHATLDEDKLNKLQHISNNSFSKV
ncbi:hypothetical protein KY330_05465 [Candidatus Woesearchaeota archaeon]|nr:hypothetical protein [Candidatus Woesearchaeota archaeon]